MSIGLNEISRICIGGRFRKHGSRIIPIADGELPFTARFAIVVALTAALALFAANHLGVTRAYWATLTVVLVMRREGMVSLKLTLQYLAGTLLGIPLATCDTPPEGELAMLASILVISNEFLRREFPGSEHHGKKREAILKDRREKFLAMGSKGLAA